MNPDERYTKIRNQAGQAAIEQGATPEQAEVYADRLVRLQKSRDVLSQRRQRMKGQDDG